MFAPKESARQGGLARLCHQAFLRLLAATMTMPLGGKLSDSTGRQVWPARRPLQGFS
jgi:hypothetical protein